MICERCGKMFIRSPPHKKRRGSLNRCRAKLCKDCWLYSMKNRTNKRLVLENNNAFK